MTDYYNNWNRTALCKVDRNYYLVNKGILSRKDYTLLFENESKKQYLPVECIDTLSAYSNITFQSNVFEYLSKKQMRVVLFDKFGNHVGSFLPNKMRNMYVRTKRPPKDEINALISFGNTWLYQRIATEIYKTSLDIRFGYMHAANRRAESLNLDIAEIFKPVIVDRCIFTVINRGEIRSKEHFEEREEGAVYLNREGKKRYVKELENKLYQKITVGNQQYTYYTIMKKEIEKLIEHLNNETTYKPYKYSN